MSTELWLRCDFCNKAKKRGEAYVDGWLGLRVDTGKVGGTIAVCEVCAAQKHIEDVLVKPQPKESESEESE